LNPDELDGPLSGFQVPPPLAPAPAGLTAPAP